MNNREKLMSIINASSFALDDVKLYLDTHPNCQEAVEYYEKQKLIRMQAVEEYTEKYGPLTSYNVNVNCGNGWTWTETPWPWEGEC